MWSLGMMWVSVAFTRPWVCVGRTLRTSFSSANIHAGFDESSLYWCLIHPLSFWEPEAISRTFAIVSAFWEVVGRPLLASSWWSSPCSANKFRNWVHFAHLKARRNMFQLVRINWLFHRVPCTRSITSLLSFMRSRVLRFCTVQIVVTVRKVGAKRELLNFVSGRAKQLLKVSSW
jgi:hypothetical protein